MRLMTLNLVEVGSSYEDLAHNFTKTRRHYLHMASVAIINLASRLLSKNLVLYSTDRDDIRGGMRREWLGELTLYPHGTPSQLHYALQTVCMAIKFNCFFRKQV